ncbi:hypothetical protein VKT23_006014 [Stygiomarasmius scandens]|uniref:Uncharacterized protein n=1 Tax=Marasmiellus scandens TaxID=2682957 RepID=A0ABR1JTG9_9AGAR
MQPKFLALLSAFVLPLVRADFRIFYAMDNTLDEGGSSTSNVLFLFNNPPDCDDVHNAVAVPAGSGNGDPNDASSGGFACDGCDSDKAPDDFDITRLEIYDGPDAVGSATDSPHGITTEALGHITLRPNDNGNFDIDFISLDGNTAGTRGTCDRSPRPGQFFQCPTGLDNPTGTEIFQCHTDLVLVEGIN